MSVETNSETTERAATNQAGHGTEMEAAAPSESHAAETQTEVSHTPTLFAEPIAHFGSFTITNSLLTSWVVVALLVLSAALIRLRMKTVPRGIQNYVELVVEAALGVADSVTGSRTRSLQFLPFVLPLFLFIVLSNWLGILPGVGSIGFIETHGGHPVFVPLFRGPSADLNFTLALACIAVVMTHIAGVLLTSTWSHLNRFVGINLLLELPKKVFVDREITAILVNPVKFFVGLVEIVGEFAKIASLSLRLFGNVFAGEVLLTVMTSLIAYAVPIPFLFLELLVGVIQGFIFSLLTLVFLTIMGTSHDEEHAEAH